MNPLVATTLRQMQAEGIAFRLPEDFDDLLELERLANESTRRTVSPEYHALLQPELQYGGVILRRLSIGAAEFLDEVVHPWFPQGGYEWQLSVWYCMAFAACPAQLWRQSHSRRAWLTGVTRWARSIDASFETMTAAVDAFLAKPDHPEAAGETASDYGWAIERLCAEYGQTPDYWVWQASTDTVSLLLLRLVERETAKGETDANSHHARWLFRFYQKRDEIRRKKSGVLQLPQLPVAPELKGGRIDHQVPRQTEGAHLTQEPEVVAERIQTAQGVQKPAQGAPAKEPCHNHGQPDVAGATATLDALAEPRQHVGQQPSIVHQALTDRDSAQLKGNVRSHVDRVSQ